MINIQKIKSFLLENKTTRQTVAKNTFWMSGSAIISYIVRILFLIYAARILGATNYGIFVYALSLIAFFTIFSDIGINAVLTRELSKKTTTGQNLINAAFTIKMFLVITSILLATLVAPIFSSIAEAKPILIFISLIFAIDASRDFIFAIIRAKEKMEYEATLNVITNILIFVMTVIAVSIKKTLLSFVVGYLSGTSISFIIIFFITKKFVYGNDKLSFNWHQAKNIINEAWPFAMLGLLGGIMVNIDNLMIGWLREAVDVGFYGVAQRPIQILYLFPGIIIANLFPAFSRLANYDNEKFKHIFEKVISFSFIMSLPLVVGGIILASDIITFLFGQEYTSAIIIFQIAILNVLFIFPATFIGNAIFAYGKQRELIKFFIIAIALIISLDYILIPQYGIVGAAIAYLISQISITIPSWFKIKKITNFTILKYMPKIMIAMITMSFFTVSLKILGIHVILNIILSSTIYLFSLNILKDPTIKSIRKSFSLSQP